MYVDPGPWSLTLHGWNMLNCSSYLNLSICSPIIEFGWIWPQCQDWAVLLQAHPFLSGESQVEQVWTGRSHLFSRVRRKNLAGAAGLFRCRAAESISRRYGGAGASCSNGEWKGFAVDRLDPGKRLRWRPRNWPPTFCKFAAALWCRFWNQVYHGQTIWLGWLVWVAQHLRVGGEVLDKGLGTGF